MKESDDQTGEKGTAVLAFGGNALLPDPFHPQEQEVRAVGLAKAVLFMLARRRRTPGGGG